MQRPAKTKRKIDLPGRPLLRTVVFLTFPFLAFFLYVWLKVEPAVEQHASGPLFRLHRSFFVPHLGYSGGLLDYASAFLAQANRYDWLGAMVMTAVGALVFLGFRTIWGRLARVRSPVLSVLPLFVLLAIRNCYGPPALAMGLGLLLALVGLAGYGLIVQFRPWQRLIGACVIGTALFLLGGVWPCLVFALTAALAELSLSRSLQLCLGTLLVSLAAGIVLLGSGCIEPTRLLNPWDTKAPMWLAGGFYGLLPLGSAVALIIAMRKRRATPIQPAAQRKGSATPGRAAWLGSAQVQQAFLVLGLVLCSGAVWLTFDEQRKTLARLDYYTSLQDYPKVIEAARLIRSLDPAAETRLHLALYHTGQLGQSLFVFTNQTSWDLLPGVATAMGAWRPQSKALFDLGLVSDAEHLAHEALEIEGNRPELLRRLAEINVIKGRPKAAGIFLNVLAQVPFERAWARTSARELEADPNLTTNANLAHVRALMVTNDLPHEGLPTKALLTHLLIANPTNQMAFEYLMATYLVNLDLKKAAERLWQLDNFNYDGIPRHFEEALLLYQQINHLKLDLRGRKVRAQTVERFERFLNLAGQQIDRTPEGQQVLAREFGDTFWLYYVLHKSETRQTSGKSPLS
jgi:tetratricopeptide (TPR) repeat protein